MLKLLIIDDEPAARDDARRLLEAFPDVNVVGEAGRIGEARELLQHADYDVVLLDVELRGGNGFDLLPHAKPEVRIIFVTAHSHYAVRAFEVNAVDYLVKPLLSGRLESSLRRVASTPPAEERPAAALKHSDLVHLKVGNGTTRFVPLADIALIESQENYTEACLVDGQRLLVRRTLKSWEEVLPADLFVRVHRRALVNLALYRGSERETEQTTLLRLEGVEEPVRASFRYLPEFKSRLSASGRRL